MIKVFGDPGSTCTRKVLTTLHEKGAAFDFEVVALGKGAHKSPEHLARQPFGQVPVLDHDGFVMYESRAIIRYLDRVLTGPSLTPADAKGAARMEQFMSVETSNFTPHAMKIVYQRVFHPMRGLPTDEAVVTAATEALQKPLDVYEAQLGATRFVAGDTFGLADITIMPYLQYLVAGRAAHLWASRPNFTRFWNEVSARDSWKKVIG